MIKVAILIDGGFFLNRYPSIRRQVDKMNAEQVAADLNSLVNAHLKKLNQIHHLSNPRALLYRAFYYDAHPFGGKVHGPCSKRALNYAASPEAKLRQDLFATLRQKPNFALRLGEVKKENDRNWVLKELPQKWLLKGELSYDQLTDEDFSPSLRQEGVDMRIGLDIATITLKKQADVIVLVTGDSDFVPAAKLARKEGGQVILDPMWRNIKNQLSEHIDAVYSGLSQSVSASST